MYQISEAELTNRINTFMVKKSEKFPELHMRQDQGGSNKLSHRGMHTSTFFEKMNDFWSTYVHA